MNVHCTLINIDLNPSIHIKCFTIYGGHFWWFDDFIDDNLDLSWHICFSLNYMSHMYSKGLVELLTLKFKLKMNLSSQMALNYFDWDNIDWSIWLLKFLKKFNLIFLLVPGLIVNIFYRHNGWVLVIPLYEWFVLLYF